MSVNQYAQHFGNGYGGNNGPAGGINIGINNARRIVSNINILNEVLRDMNQDYNMNVEEEEDDENEDEPQPFNYN